MGRTDSGISRRKDLQRLSPSFRENSFGFPFQGFMKGEIDAQAQESEMIPNSNLSRKIVEENYDDLNVTNIPPEEEERDQGPKESKDLTGRKTSDEGSRTDPELLLLPAKTDSGVTNLFRNFMVNLPSLDKPRNRLQSIEGIEISRSQKSQDQSENQSGDQSEDQSNNNDPFEWTKLEGSRTPAPEQHEFVEPLEASRNTARANFSSLSWRLDPRESLSDWQIKVARTDSGKADLYNVHRMVLAVGPRESEYFANLFQKQIQDPNGHRLRLEMPDDFADVFPVVLDFMYGENDIPTVQKRKHAFRVYDQAEYFKMAGLKGAVANWFRKRLEWFDVPQFLKDIQRFQDNAPLVRVAIAKCAIQFEEFGPQFALKIGPSVLLQVFELLWSSRYIFHHQADYVASLILECFQAYQVDGDTFSRLTDNRFLPVVPPGAAIKLLGIGSKWRDPCDRSLSCLETRCVRSLARHWGTLCYEFPSAEAMAESLSNLPPPVLAQLLVKTSEVPW